MIIDYLLLSPNFFDLAASYLQKMFDNVLLTQFFNHLAADYRYSLNKSFKSTSDWILFQ